MHMVFPLTAHDCARLPAAPTLPLPCAVLAASQALPSACVRCAHSGLACVCLKEQKREEEKKEKEKKCEVQKSHYVNGARICARARPRCLRQQLWMGLAITAFPWETEARRMHGRSSGHSS